jgi:hypothetical protein
MDWNVDHRALKQIARREVGKAELASLLYMLDQEAARLDRELTHELRRLRHARVRQHVQSGFVAAMATAATLVCYIAPFVR